MDNLRLFRVEYRRLQRGREDLDVRYVYAKTAKMAEQAHPVASQPGSWELKSVMEVTNYAISNRGASFVLVGLPEE